MIVALKEQDLNLLSMVLKINMLITDENLKNRTKANIQTIIEPTKKNALLIALRISDFRNTVIPMPNAAKMGRPNPPNKAKGPGIIPIPNIGDSLGMSTKPPVILARYKANAINWSFHSIWFNTFMAHKAEVSCGPMGVKPEQAFTINRRITRRQFHRVVRRFLYSNHLFLECSID